MVSKSSDRLLRWKELKTVVNVSRATIWRYENAGLFPKRRCLGAGKTVAWLESEVMEWMKKQTIVCKSS